MKIKIDKIRAREILDSRGNPTIEVETVLENGIIGIASVPSGASKGSYEAVELLDNDPERYMGKGVLKAVNNVRKEIYPELKGKNVFNQYDIDMILNEIDGTENKSQLGANAILGVSLSVLKSASKSLGLPIYQYIGGINSNILPIPMFNILNGGEHANNSVNIQEFMIIPISSTYSKGLQMSVEVYHTLKRILKESGYIVAVGDEGGFAPSLANDEDALIYIIKAIKEAGYQAGKDFVLALDVAATEMYDKAKKMDKPECYYFWKTGDVKSREEMITYLEYLCDKYPIVSIEDGCAEDDIKGWMLLTERLGHRVRLVGDDLFVTNIQRLRKGKDLGIANSILIKPNQIGTVSQTLQTVNYAKRHGFGTVLSHRSGETEDTVIVDMAVGLNAGQIKIGAPCRTDRVSKYNQLIRIEEELGERARYFGMEFFSEHNS